MEVMSSVRRSISITEEQDSFLRKHSISLSKLTQKAIEQDKEDHAFAVRTEKALKEMEAGHYIEFGSMEEFIEEAKKW